MFLCYLVVLYLVPTLMVNTDTLNNQLMVGNPEEIICTVSDAVGVELNLVMISWMGPGGEIITNSSRVTISPTTSSGNDFTSRLLFEYLMEGDNGMYTCNVTILERRESSVLDLSLIGKPAFPFLFHHIP